MTDLGKIDAATFERVISGATGADRSDLCLGPTPGIDFGVVDVGGRAVVCSTDPFSVPKALGPERAARLATDIVLADVAVSGVPPSHLTIALSLPPEYPQSSHEAIWTGIDAHARAFDVAVTAATPGRYPGIASSWIGGATALGVGDHADIVRPDGACPGHELVVSTGPGAEVAGLFAWCYPDALDVDDTTIQTARERIDDVYAVGDALAAHDAGRVTAMHDATEGGMATGLVELAAGAGVRIDIDRAAVPVQAGVEAVCAAVGIDPWQVTSCGTLLITVEPADADTVVHALEARGTPAAVVGRVREGSDVYVDGERISPPDADPSWSAAASLSEI